MTEHSDNPENSPGNDLGNNTGANPKKLKGIRRRGIYLLPNLMTTAALFAGFYSIVAAIDGNFIQACIAHYIAMIFDGLDGRLARLTHTESDFGKEYDSLSDMVAFGVAPAIVVYQWGLERLADYGWMWGKLGWLAAFFYAVAAAMRLARFNTYHGKVAKSHFEGLPSPPAASLIIGMVWLGTDLGWSGTSVLVGAFFITIAAGALMVSPFSYNSFKEISVNGRISFTYALVLPLIFIMVAINPPLVLFGLAFTYAVSGLWLSFWRRQGRQDRRAKRSGDQQEF
ncbi:MAG: CDP-diacylglycerol--serine O-phosphatidyltransferase [Gammaproteobacteria bacterium]|nr:CDP-diacylglycerol--serine O-phosphatidyltransferase [Gammaproteobacteria bacterium]MCP4277390.1 CDP-diacylglycerol--serine O-phosphatidyltransferase [Gammaproteobacteria bacterium]MCP4831549.1 CDP-diacylglycerol--serine O-phosphatidyltransferase [Gammaproteobacteria bacterium]MCP4927772.1 CDP-diacylglycerol--serine O-phosphatidyltransferase [Gammaproteobacteria bacterium]